MEIRPGQRLYIPGVRVVQLDMLPDFTRDNLANSCKVYTVFFSQKPMGFAFLCSLANIVYILLCQFCQKVSGAFAGRKFVMSILGNHVIDVIDVSSQKQMFRIAAWWIIASMTNLFGIFGNGAMMKFVRNSMRSVLFSVKFNQSIAVLRGSARPSPAFIRTAPINVLPKSFFLRWAFLYSSIVPGNETDVLPLDMSKLRIGMFGDRGYLTAATFAKFWFWRWCKFALAVVLYVSKWLTLRPAFFRAAFGCNSGFLTTTTPALTGLDSVGDFLCVFVCVKITHVDKLLSAVGQSGGALWALPGVFIGSYSCNYSIFRGVAQEL